MTKKKLLQEFLTSEELSKRWGVSVQTLANKRSRGSSIAYYKIGAKVRYSLRDIEDHERVNLITAGEKTGF